LFQWFPVWILITTFLWWPHRKEIKRVLGNDRAGRLTGAHFGSTMTYFVVSESVPNSGERHAYDYTY
jgi:hypothetical protein